MNYKNQQKSNSSLIFFQNTKSSLKKKNQAKQLMQNSLFYQEFVETLNNFVNVFNSQSKENYCYALRQLYSIFKFEITYPNKQISDLEILQLLIYIIRTYDNDEIIELSLKIIHKLTKEYGFCNDFFDLRLFDILFAMMKNKNSKYFTTIISILTNFIIHQEYFDLFPQDIIMNILEVLYFSEMSTIWVYPLRFFEYYTSNEKINSESASFILQGLGYIVSFKDNLEENGNNFDQIEHILSNLIELKSINIEQFKQLGFENYILYRLKRKIKSKFLYLLIGNLIFNYGNEYQSLFPIKFGDILPLLDLRNENLSFAYWLLYQMIVSKQNIIQNLNFKKIVKIIIKTINDTDFNTKRYSILLLALIYIKLPLDSFYFNYINEVISIFYQGLLIGVDFEIVHEISLALVVVKKYHESYNAEIENDEFWKSVDEIKKLYMSNTDLDITTFLNVFPINKPG